MSAVHDCKGKKCRILVADQSKSCRKFHMRLLTGFGFSCVEVIGNGEYVVSIIHETIRSHDRLHDTFDIIVIGGNMKVMDGSMTAIRVRELGFRGIIIVVTCRNCDHDLACFKESGADAVIQKPLAKEIFTKVLKDIESRCRYDQMSKKMFKEILGRSRKKALVADGSFSSRKLVKSSLTKMEFAVVDADGNGETIFHLIKNSLLEGLQLHDGIHKFETHHNSVLKSMHPDESSSHVSSKSKYVSKSKSEPVQCIANRIRRVIEMNPGSTSGAESWIRSIFDEVDRDYDGFISHSELKQALLKIGVDIKVDEAMNILAYFDRDCNGRLDFPEFKHVVGLAVLPKRIQTIVDSIRDKLEADLKSPAVVARFIGGLFYELDENADGRVSHAEFKRAMSKIKAEVSREESLEVLRHFDSDSNGSLDYKEFLHLMGLKPTATGARSGAGAGAGAVVDSSGGGVGCPKRIQVATKRIRLAVENYVQTLPFATRRLKELFKAMDVNGDCHISISELRRAMLNIEVELTLDDAADLMKLFDGTGSGGLCEGEFLCLVGMNLNRGRAVGGREAVAVTTTEAASDHLTPYRMRASLHPPRPSAVQHVHDGDDSGAPFDMVVMEDTVRGSGGHMTARRLRQLGFKGLIVIMCDSASTDEVAAFKECGANAVVINPASAAKISEAFEDSKSHHVLRPHHTSEAATQAIPSHIATFRRFKFDSHRRMQQLRVLMVDESAACRSANHRLLHEHGHVVVEADCGLVATEMVRKALYAASMGALGCSYDVVLLSCSMKGMSGTETARQLRLESFAGLIFGLIHNAHERDIKNYRSHGADNVLSKPLTVDSFSDMIRGVCFPVKDGSSKLDHIRGIDTKKRPANKAVSMEYSMALLLKAVKTRMHIMVVDESLSQLKAMDNLLAVAGHTVALARTTSEAIGVMKKTNVNAVFGDINAPIDVIVMNHMVAGPDSARAVEIFLQRGFRGILVGVHSEPPAFIPLDIQKSGVHCLLHKPFTVESFNKALAKLKADAQQSLGHSGHTSLNSSEKGASLASWKTRAVGFVAQSFKGHEEVGRGSAVLDSQRRHEEVERGSAVLDSQRRRDNCGVVDLISSDAAIKDRSIKSLPMKVFPLVDRVEPLVAALLDIDRAPAVGSGDTGLVATMAKIDDTNEVCGHSSAHKGRGSSSPSVSEATNFSVLEELTLTRIRYRASQQHGWGHASGQAHANAAALPKQYRQPGGVAIMPRAAPVGVCHRPVVQSSSRHLSGEVAHEWVARSIVHANSTSAAVTAVTASGGGLGGTASVGGGAAGLSAVSTALYHQRRRSQSHVTSLATSRITTESRLRRQTFEPSVGLTRLTYDDISTEMNLKEESAKLIGKTIPVMFPDYTHSRRNNRSHHEQLSMAGNRGGRGGEGGGGSLIDKDDVRHRFIDAAVENSVILKRSGAVGAACSDFTVQPKAAAPHTQHQHQHQHQLRCHEDFDMERYSYYSSDPARLSLGYDPQLFVNIPVDTHKDVGDGKSASSTAATVTVSIGEPPAQFPPQNRHAAQSVYSSSSMSPSLVTNANSTGKHSYKDFGRVTLSPLVLPPAVDGLEGEKHLQQQSTCRPVSSPVSASCRDSVAVGWLVRARAALEGPESPSAR